MKKDVCLVTGGAGFIGSYVVDRLIERDYLVVVLDDLSGGYKRNVNKKAVFVEGSILNEELLDNLFDKYNFDFVFHLAAYAAEGLSHFIRKFNYENNLIGSINLINRSIKNNVKQFVFTSSIAVYGENQLPMVENLEPEPKDPYGISKHAVELDLLNAQQMFGLDYTIFRPHNVYGERQNFADPYRNVIGIFINKLMHGEPVTIFGDGRQTRAFTYIEDISPAIASSIVIDAAKNQIFNIGSDKPYSVLELANIVVDKMDLEKEGNIKYLEPRNEVEHAYADHSKARDVFPNVSETPLEVGIDKMIQWCKEIGPLEGSKFSNIEVYKNMPPSWRKLVS